MCPYSGRPVLIPLSTDRPSARSATVTPVLTGACVLVHLALAALGSLRPDLARGIEQAGLLVPGQSAWYTYFSYAFLHAGFWHIAGNMLILWVFGPPVEDRFGRFGFLAFYLCGAGAAGGLHALFEGAPVVGASGAIAAVTGAFLVMFPFTHVRCWFILFFSVSVVPAWWFIGLAMLWDLVLQGMGHGGGVARLAHLGGYALGAGTAAALLAGGLLPREPHDLFTMAVRAKRKRAFRAQVAAAERERAGPAEAPDDARARAIAEQRSALTRLLSGRDGAAVARAYLALLDAARGAGTGLSVLPPRQQLDLATLLHGTGEHAACAQACAWFIAAYPRDPQTPDIRVLGALTHLRHVPDAHAARAMLDGLTTAPPGTGDLVAALRSELTALEAQPGPSRPG